jgi:hypothetical protein
MSKEINILIKQIEEERIHNSYNNMNEEWFIYLFNSNYLLGSFIKIKKQIKKHKGIIE